MIKRTTKLTTLACIFISTWCIYATSSLAQTSIGVNFTGRNGGPTSLQATDTAGVLPQTNWVNLASDTPDFDGSVQLLPTSDGAETIVRFEWVANDSWNAPGPTSTPDEQLMKGIQKINPTSVLDHASSFMNLRWHNLPTGNTFNAIVYFNHNTPNAKGYAQAGTNTVYLGNETGFSGTYIQATNTVDGTYPIANYALFENVSPNSSGTLEVTMKKFLEDPQLTDGFGVPAAQLELVSGSWPVATTPPIVLLQPIDYLGVVGDELTFSTAADAPWNIEWFTNGVSAASGTETDVTFTSVSAHAGGSVYAVISNIAGSVTTEVATITLDEPIPPQLVQGFLHVEHYGNLGGVIVTSLYANADVQARNFEFDFYNPGAAVPGVVFNNFGRLIEGFIRPDVSGDYHLFTRSDDQSEFYFNPVPSTNVVDIPTDFANLDYTTFEPDCCDPFQEPGIDTTTSTNFNLVADAFYPISALYKDGNGGDFFELAWRETNDTTIAANLLPIGPENVYTFTTPAGKRAMITQQPTSTNVSEIASATFTVAAESMPVADQLGYQWFLNGNLIPGAIGTTYTTNSIDRTANGYTVFAKVYTLIGVMTSDVATITVDADLTPPNLLSAGTFPGENLLGLEFDEPMDLSIATNTLNYQIDGATVTNVEVLASDDHMMILSLDTPATLGGSITITNLTDRFDNPLATTNLAIQTSPLTPQTLGTPLKPGRSAYFGDDTYYIEAGGNDIWAATDNGYMVSQTWTGAFDMRVRLQSLSGPNPWTKAGIMIRETLNSNARNNYVLGTRTAGQNLITHQWRDATSSASGALPNGARVSPVPYPNAWLRLTRDVATNNVFESYVSTNGINWTVLGTHTLPGDLLSPSVTIGMAATSHDDSAGANVAEMVFRSFEIIGTNTPPLTPVPLVVENIGGSFQIDWNTSENWILQTTTNVLIGPWIDLPTVTPPLNIGATNRVDYYRLKITQP